MIDLLVTSVVAHDQGLSFSLFFRRAKDPLYSEGFVTTLLEISGSEFVGTDSPHSATTSRTDHLF